MRIESVKISGFKPIPFCANFRAEEKNIPAQITWEDKPFQISFANSAPLINAIIGPNSSGKSSIFYALDKFFSSARKLEVENFNNKETGKPVIVEVVFSGKIPSVEQWHLENCDVKNPTLGQESEGKFILAVMWQGGENEGRTDYIRRPNGALRKVTGNDTKTYKPLLPKYRLISADSRLSEQANPEKNDLLTDLIDDVIANVQRPESAIFQISQKINEIKALTSRVANDDAWHEIEQLEEEISNSLSPITSTTSTVRLQIQQNVPDTKNIFLQGKIQIEDGVDLNFSQHGLGVQRSFVASVLHVWCKQIGHKKDFQDYVFAIEEPELYLHPHATRAFIKTLENIAQNEQIIFTTHSTEFANRVPLENIIRLQRNQNLRAIKQPNFSTINPRFKEKTQRYIQENRSDMLFARAVLLVEGQTEFFALPGLFKTLELDLDKAGISLVWVEGKGNFEAYHHTLRAFDIPHIIFGDGDGQKEIHQNKYSKWIGSENVFVLDVDFETTICSILPYERLVEIVNACRSELGERDLPNKAAITPKTFEKVGKPLAGRIVGQMLKKEEIAQIPEIVNLLQRVLALR
jgi:predicted ATP-dependent endonuclease of OLD family